MNTRQYTCVARNDLGETRISSYTLHNSLSAENDFIDKTPAELKKLVRENKVNGLRLDAHGEIQLDEAFEQRNLVIKSATRFRNMIDTGRSAIGYSVIKKYMNDIEDSFEIVTSRCGRFICSVYKLLSLYDFADVAGVRIKNGHIIETCEGVEIINMRTSSRDYLPDEVVDVGGQLMKVNELDDLTPEELFGTGQEEKADNSLAVITDAPEPEKLETDTPEAMEKPAPVKKPASKGSAKKK